VASSGGAHGRSGRPHLRDGQTSLDKQSAAPPANEEIGRGLKLTLHLTLGLEQFIGPQHLQGRLHPVGPLLVFYVFQGLPQDVMEHVIIRWRLSQLVASVCEQIGEFLVPAVAGGVGVA